MFVSVIVPVHNGQDYLARTLAAIRSSDYPDFELIVVDDASTDSSVSAARGFADQLIELKVCRAPGYARNQGAQRSRGDILFFADADVEIRRRTISRIVEEFAKDPGLAAVFGSYDDAPEQKNFFSQYKNLFHHFVHQEADPDAKTFWAGCGAMRRDVFFENKGFVESFNAPAIEDVILGYSLAERGQRIRLIKDLQVKHLKAWSFWNLLKTDIFQRAVPWTRLTIEKGLPADLNFKVSDRVSALCAWGLLLSLIFWLFYSFAGIISIFFVAILLGLNRELYAFFLRNKGAWFASRAVLFHWFYFLYSSLVFCLFALIFKLPATSGTAYWTKVIIEKQGKPCEDLWRVNMLAIYDDLLRRWLGRMKGGVALKTDLYDEAVSDHHPMPLLLERYDLVFGIDLSLEVVRSAAGRMISLDNAIALKTFVSDARHLAFKSGTFDFIFSNSSLDHFEKKEDIKTALKEFIRVLKPKGTIALTLDNPLNPVVCLRNLLPYAWLKPTGLIPYYMGRTMPRRELVSVLSSYGLQVQESGYINHVPRLPVIWLGRFLENNKNERFRSFLEKSMGWLEKLSLLPTRPLTGYYVAVKAVKR